MARASAEGNVEVFPAAQSTLKILADVAHHGNCPVVPKGHASFENWSRSQLQQYLNYRIGGINKYANYSRPRLIQRLLRIETGPKEKCPVSRKERVKEKSRPGPAVEDLPRPTRATETPVFQTLRKRSRKGEKVRRLPALDQGGFQDRLCGNAACRAKLSGKEEFCRRCSCCICKRFDDNKDPCLWIECGGEKYRSCGASCHLECGLKLRAAGVVKRGNTIQLDGSFSCVNCGFISCLLGCWRRLLSVAKNARRIDVFTTRLSLAFRLLDGTLRYKNLHDMVADAVRALEKELGPGGLAAAMRTRGLVTRLSCGVHVQNQIENAIKKASSWPVEQETQRIFVTKGGALERIYKTHIEQVTPESAVVSWSGTENTLGDEVIGHSVWCRAAGASNFPEGPVCSVPGGEVTKAVVTGLYPGVDYELRLVPLTGSGEFGRIEARFSTPRLDHDLEPFHKLLDGGKGDLSFRIREVGKFFHGDGTATTMRNALGSQLHSPASGELFSVPVEEANATTVEEEKHVISETVPSSQKKNDSQGSKSVAKRLYCSEDMDEVLKDVEDRERIDLNKSRVHEKESLPLQTPKQRIVIEKLEKSSMDSPVVGCANEEKETIQQQGHDDVVDEVSQKEMDAPTISKSHKLVMEQQDTMVAENVDDQKKTIQEHDHADHAEVDDVIEKHTQQKDEVESTIQLQNHLVADKVVAEKVIEQMKTIQPQIGDTVLELNNVEEQPTPVLENEAINHLFGDKVPEKNNVEQQPTPERAIEQSEAIQPQNHLFGDKVPEKNNVEQQPTPEKTIEQSEAIQPQNHLFGDEVPEKNNVALVVIEQNEAIEQQNHLVGNKVPEKNTVEQQPTPVVEKAIEKNDAIQQQKQNLDEAIEQEKNQIREQHQSGVIKSQDLPSDRSQRNREQHRNGVVQHENVNKLIRQKSKKTIVPPQRLAKVIPETQAQQDRPRQAEKKRKKIIDDHLSLGEPQNDVDTSGDFWSEDYLDKSLEFSIKVIVWLERQGHLQPDFRLKLLTWLGFRASVEEKKMIFVYVRTLLTDPHGLAHQLVDTFGEIVATQRLRAEEASS
ncbi:hypothetical protein SELMODRAFT_448182 [Selaginella moellendorffii]|uniref:Fibronectin type-III domain-containing protein n=1 Tax=Selaginella moellendorffii TaxID=88036 RepID=D8T5E0_SELML|nr:uncharacterized protein LOC9658556 [Selaginella moellendorffii]EFJ08125.1 hypothetical protein SELMODRAFT_448182 [Selaginella moellendorffii]|eukprot:XP_002990852.1 uncharacterized protein LOC9658556 [Selaginella moellendorffii]